MTKLTLARSRMTSVSSRRCSCWSSPSGSPSPRTALRPCRGVTRPADHRQVPGSTSDASGHAAHAGDPAEGRRADHYDIAVKQFCQYMLPERRSKANAVGPSAVWSYASMIEPRRSPTAAR
jgi:hypothetical protein